MKKIILFIQDCLSVKGRWKRDKFWLYPLGIISGVFFLSLCFALVLGDGNIFSQIIAIVGSIFFMITMIFAYIKRLHDLDKSGKYIIILFIPIAGIIGLHLYCGFVKGSKKRNFYG